MAIITAAHRFLLEDPRAQPSHEPQEAEADRAANEGEGEAVHSATDPRDEQAEHETADGELIGNDVGAGIGDEDAEQQGEEHRGADRGEGGTEEPDEVDPDDGGGELDQRVHDGDRLAACAALAAQDEPGEHRNIVVPGDLLAALRAT
jgi:hypothetical protein